MKITTKHCDHCGKTPCETIFYNYRFENDGNGHNEETSDSVDLCIVSMGKIINDITSPRSKMLEGCPVARFVKSNCNWKPPSPKS